MVAGFGYAPRHPGVVKAKEDKLPRRNRYQFGSLELRKRTKGVGCRPDASAKIASVAMVFS